MTNILVFKPKAVMPCDRPYRASIAFSLVISEDFWVFTAIAKFSAQLLEGTIAGETKKDPEILTD